MKKLVNKLVIFILIFSLFFGRGLHVIDSSFAQEVAPPTSVPSSANTSQNSSPPSSLANVPPPTGIPVPTVPAQSNPSSVPSVSVSYPSPTSIPVPSPDSQSASQNVTPSPPNISVSPTDIPFDTSSSEQTSGSSSDNKEEGDTGSASGYDSVNDPANTNTGAFSTNNATETNKNWQEVINNNLAELQNKIDAISNSGFNYANLNTLQGQVFTGDSQASVNLLNKLNSNMTGLGGFSVFNVYDTQFGDIVFKFADKTLDSFTNATSTVAKNSQTGPGSVNNAIADNSFTVKEANGNDAKLTNDINLQAVTGGNEASYNTGGGTIKTGDSTALGNIINMANTNLNVSKWLIGVVNIFGTLAGNIILPKDDGNLANKTAPTVLVENSNTGTGSTNNAAYTDNQTANYTNNNTVDIVSTLNVTANTGNNTASVNTGGGSVKTGLSDASVSNSTIANTNTINEEGMVWLVIVNEMGKWVGHIIGMPWGTHAASNGLPISQTTGGAGSQSYVVAQNSNTGPSSTNNSTFNNTSDTDVTNNNTASISNNITANADTGDNQAAYNTGAGQIETGDAKVGLNLVNMVNTNVVAKKFVAVLVNVLGNFLGSIIPPDQQQNSQIADSSTASAGTITSNNTSGNSQQSSYNFQPTPTPTPTVYQPASFTTATTNIGGIGSTADTYQSGSYDNQNQMVADAYNSSSQNSNNANQAYSGQYNRAVGQVSQAKSKMYADAKRFNQNTVGQYNYVIGNQAKTLKRGLFISPAFAKATETSFAGMLLGGASIRVNESWLSVVPLALLVVLLRRRRKFDPEKYLNALLEIIL